MVANKTYFGSSVGRSFETQTELVQFIWSVVRKENLFFYQSVQFFDAAVWQCVGAESVHDRTYLVLDFKDHAYIRIGLVLLSVWYVSKGPNKRINELFWFVPMLE